MDCIVLIFRRRLCCVLCTISRSRALRWQLPHHFVGWLASSRVSSRFTYVIVSIQHHYDFCALMIRWYAHSDQHTCTHTRTLTQKRTACGCCLCYVVIVRFQQHNFVNGLCVCSWIRLRGVYCLPRVWRQVDRQCRLCAVYKHTHERMRTARRVLMWTVRLHFMCAHTSSAVRWVIHIRENN